MIIEPIENKITIHSLNRASGSLDNLDQAFLEALSDKVSVMHEMKIDITTLTKSPDKIADPATLMRLQAMLADYSLNVELASKVAQRVINGIDSLVKS